MISSASADQAQGLTQINSVISEIETVTLQTSKSADDSASASKEMENQADQMNMMLDGLVKLVGLSVVGDQNKHTETSSLSTRKKEKHLENAFKGAGNKNNDLVRNAFRKE